MLAGFHNCCDQHSPLLGRTFASVAATFTSVGDNICICWANIHNCWRQHSHLLRTTFTTVEDNTHVCWRRIRSYSPPFTNRQDPRPKQKKPANTGFHPKTAGLTTSLVHLYSKPESVTTPEISLGRRLCTLLALRRPVQRKLCSHSSYMSVLIGNVPSHHPHSV